MGYVKAETILPYSLLMEIQKYIPCENTTRKKWGEKSGNREHIQNRNQEIRNKHKNGYAILDLADEFFLSIDSIKKIVYTKK